DHKRVKDIIEIRYLKPKITPNDATAIKPKTIYMVSFWRDSSHSKPINVKLVVVSIKFLSTHFKAKAPTASAKKTIPKKIRKTISEELSIFLNACCHIFYNFFIKFLE